jgi:hypothetical protein
MSLDTFRQLNKVRESKSYPRPKPGSYYVVERGKTLLDVSRQAYGYDKASLIVDSNTNLQQRLVGADGLPPIHQDESIYLPAEVD